MAKHADLVSRRPSFLDVLNGIGDDENDREDRPTRHEACVEPSSQSCSQSTSFRDALIEVEADVGAQSRKPKRRWPIGVLRRGSGAFTPSQRSGHVASCETNSSTASFAVQGAAGGVELAATQFYSQVPEETRDNPGQSPGEHGEDLFLATQWYSETAPHAASPQQKGEYWQCKICDEMNRSSRAVCNNCGSPSPVPKSESNELTRTPGSSSSSSTINKPAPSIDLDSNKDGRRNPPGAFAGAKQSSVKFFSAPVVGNAQLDLDDFPGTQLYVDTLEDLESTVHASRERTSMTSTASSSVHSPHVGGGTESHTGEAESNLYGDQFPPTQFYSEMERCTQSGGFLQAAAGEHRSAMAQVSSARPGDAAQSEARPSSRPSLDDTPLFLEERCDGARVSGGLETCAPKASGSVVEGSALHANFESFPCTQLYMEEFGKAEFHVQAEAPVEIQSPSVDAVANPQRSGSSPQVAAHGPWEHANVDEFAPTLLYDASEVDPEAAAQPAAHSSGDAVNIDEFAPTLLYDAGEVDHEAESPPAANVDSSERSLYVRSRCQEQAVEQSRGRVEDVREMESAATSAASDAEAAKQMVDGSREPDLNDFPCTQLYDDALGHVVASLSRASADPATMAVQSTRACTELTEPGADLVGEEDIDGEHLDGEDFPCTQLYTLNVHLDRAGGELPGLGAHEPEADQFPATQYYSSGDSLNQQVHQDPVAASILASNSANAKASKPLLDSSVSASSSSGADEDAGKASAFEELACTQLDIDAPDTPQPEAPAIIDRVDHDRAASSTQTVAQVGLRSDSSAPNHAVNSGALSHGTEVPAPCTAQPSEVTEDVRSNEREKTEEPHQATGREDIDGDEFPCTQFYAVDLAKLDAPREPGKADVVPNGQSQVGLDVQHDSAKPDSCEQQCDNSALGCQSAKLGRENVEDQARSSNEGACIDSLPDGSKTCSHSATEASHEAPSTKATESAADAVTAESRSLASSHDVCPRRGHECADAGDLPATQCYGVDFISAETVHHALLANNLGSSSQQEKGFQSMGGDEFPCTQLYGQDLLISAFDQHRFLQQSGEGGDFSTTTPSLTTKLDLESTKTINEDHMMETLLYTDDATLGNCLSQDIAATQFYADDCRNAGESFREIAVQKGAPKNDVSSCEHESVKDKAADEDHLKSVCDIRQEDHERDNSLAHESVSVQHARVDESSGVQAQDEAHDGLEVDGHGEILQENAGIQSSSANMEHTGSPSRDDNEGINICQESASEGKSLVQESAPTREKDVSDIAVDPNDEQASRSAMTSPSVKEGDETNGNVTQKDGVDRSLFQEDRSVQDEGTSSMVVEEQKRGPQVDAASSTESPRLAIPQQQSTSAHDEHHPVPNRIPKAAISAQREDTGDERLAASLKHPVQTERHKRQSEDISTAAPSTLIDRLKRRRTMGVMAEAAASNAGAVVNQAPVSAEPGARIKRRRLSRKQPPPDPNPYAPNNAWNQICPSAAGCVVEPEAFDDGTSTMAHSRQALLTCPASPIKQRVVADDDLHEHAVLQASAGVPEHPPAVATPSRKRNLSRVASHTSAEDHLVARSVAEPPAQAQARESTASDEVQPPCGEQLTSEEASGAMRVTHANSSSEASVQLEVADALPAKPTAPAIRLAMPSAMPSTPARPAIRSALRSATPATPATPALRSAIPSATPATPATPAFRPAPPAMVQVHPGMPMLRQACFTATGLELSQRQRKWLVNKLGARVVDDWCSDVTHLISDTFRRTTKLMCAVCSGAHIVTPAYVKACIGAGCLVDDTPFLLRDEVCESAFAKKRGLSTYSLQAAVEQARCSGPLLAGVSVHCAPDVPGMGELQTLVEAAGGRWLEGLPTEPPSNALESTSTDSVLLLSQIGSSSKREEGCWTRHAAYDVELLREAACTQSLNYDRYRI